MIDIIPAIIPESFDDLKGKMSLVKGFTNIVQIDICDGKFVPSKSWPYVGDYEGDFRNITEEKTGFPFWDSMDFEVDLMVSNPENVVEDWIRAGAKRLVIHLESAPNIKDLIKDFRKKYGWFGDSPLSVEFGIALNIKTFNEEIFEFLEPNADGRSLVDFVQFMGIREVGYQNQSFDETVLAKIRDLREKFRDTIISVDGGVNFENAHGIIEAGASRLVSGSTIYESENIKEAIEQLKNS